MSWLTLRKKLIPTTERWTAVAYGMNSRNPIPSNRYFSSKRRAEYWANSHSHFIVEVYEREGISPWFAIPASEERLHRSERDAIFGKLFKQAGYDYPTYYALVERHETEAARA